MLYGRDLERARIGELLDGARKSRSGVLVLLGEAGIGKSALLDDAREHASDMRVLAASGVESEAQLPFAALHQLVRPVLGYLGNVPKPQAHALRGALGMEASAASDRFLVSLAVLSLLAEAAEDRPLLCLIDDAHWLDEASADALVFVARRIEAEGIVMLLSAREREVRRFDARGLSELRLGALDPDAAGALLDRRVGVALSSESRQRLIRATGGNPLALMELPALLSEAQLTGGEPLLDPLPVSARVERAFLSRVRELPEDTQTLLLVCATDDSGEVATVLSAAARLGVSLEALDAAEQAALVHVHGTTLELHHPLVRSAVYQGATLSRRRAAHGALASVLDGESEADRRAALSRCTAARCSQATSRKPRASSTLRSPPTERQLVHSSARGRNSRSESSCAALVVGSRHVSTFVRPLTRSRTWEQGRGRSGRERSCAPAARRPGAGIPAQGTNLPRRSSKSPVSSRKDLPTAT